MDIRRLGSPWRYAVPTKTINSYLLKGFKLPKGGWNARSFATHGRGLIIALTRKAKLAQKKAVPYVAKIAQGIYNKQIERVIQKATGIIYAERSIKSKEQPTVWIDLMLPEQEAIWVSAIKEVFGTADLDVVIDLVPPISSVMGQAYGQTSELMGLDTDPEGRAKLSREAQEIAKDIVGINDTSINRIEKLVRDSIDQGLTVTETANRMREELPEKNLSRSMTIARTELSNAWSQGSVEAFKGSTTLTHISVIGCEAVEPNCPTYEGRPTCNIDDVPIEDANILEFHPNHTGVMVPSRFAEA